MKEHTLYFVKVNWFNDYDDTDKTSKFFTFASNFKELGEKLDNCFKYINEVKIEEVNSMCGSDDIFWLDSDEITKKMIEAFKNANYY